jgi:hypothetical protein
MDRRAFLQASVAAALMSRWAGVHADDLAAYKPAVPGRPAPKPSRFGKTAPPKTPPPAWISPARPPWSPAAIPALGLEPRRVLGIICSLRQLQLTGRTYAGQEIYGSDFIRTVSCAGK